MIYQKLSEVQSELGTLKGTVNKDGFTILPYDELLSIVQPVLRDKGLFLYHYEEIRDSGYITVTTTVVDVENGREVTSSPGLQPIKLAGMSFTYSRISLSTILKRIGILEVLGIAISNEEIDDPLSSGSAKTLKPGSVEYENVKKSLLNNEVDYDTIKNMYQLTPEQEVDLSILEF